ncbi:MAG TPA: BadF/BadG/BcrA/BcrD ATPase family protein [Propionicimonas sp.]|nr:BadF/BadG/BcrA/BcrD ATPase family protein [Propionicimonas sp.]
MSERLAVDAGQTGIRLRWEHGTDRLHGEAPGVLTDRPLMPQLAAVIGDLVTTNGLAPEFVGVGCSGLVTPEATELLGLLSRYGVREVAVAHDATTNYLGALGERPGAVIAAGTGVVTLAVGRTVARVDGWGYLIGDSGSAYWIGRAGMEAAMRGFDRRGQLTALTDRMQALFGDLRGAYVELQSDERRVSRIADFAQVVDELAGSDPVAARIIDSAAAELSESVLAGLRRVCAMDDPLVCALGQVLRSTNIRTRFVRYLRMQWPKLELTEPLGNALDGAGRLAGLDPRSPLSGLVARAVS